MPDNTITEIEFQGIKFMETIRPPNYSPGSDFGMLIWEAGPEMAIIQEPFDFKDPRNPTTLEDARTKIENLILYCRK